MAAGDGKSKRSGRSVMRFEERYFGADVRHSIATGYQRAVRQVEKVKECHPKLGDRLTSDALHQLAALLWNYRDDDAAATSFIMGSLMHLRDNDIDVMDGQFVCSVLELRQVSTSQFVSAILRRQTLAVEAMENKLKCEPLELIDTLLTILKLLLLIKTLPTDIRPAPNDYSLAATITAEIAEINAEEVDALRSLSSQYTLGQLADLLVETHDLEGELLEAQKDHQKVLKVGVQRLCQIVESGAVAEAQSIQSTAELLRENLPLRLNYTEDDRLADLKRTGKLDTLENALSGVIPCEKNLQLLLKDENFCNLVMRNAQYRHRFPHHSADNALEERRAEVQTFSRLSRDNIASEDTKLQSYRAKIGSKVGNQAVESHNMPETAPQVGRQQDGFYRKEFSGKLPRSVPGQSRGHSSSNLSKPPTEKKIVREDPNAEQVSSEESHDSQVLRHSQAAIKSNADRGNRILAVAGDSVPDDVSPKEAKLFMEKPTNTAGSDLHASQLTHTPQADAVADDVVVEFPLFDENVEDIDRQLDSMGSYDQELDGFYPSDETYQSLLTRRRELCQKHVATQEARTERIDPEKSQKQLSQLNKLSGNTNKSVDDEPFITSVSEDALSAYFDTPWD